jgi:hypothetical protein
MPVEPPVAILIAVAAFGVAAMVTRRTGAYADRKAGRASEDDRAPIGPALDALDRTSVAHAIRERLGISTVTRDERRMAEQRAAAVARVDEIRLAGEAPPRHAGPRRLVVSGAASAVGAASVVRPSGPLGGPIPRPYVAPRSTVSVELLAAGLGLVVVIGIVVGIWPREPGARVLSATGAPAVVSPSPTPSPSPSGELAID